MFYIVLLTGNILNGVSLIAISACYTPEFACHTYLPRLHCTALSNLTNFIVHSHNCYREDEWVMLMVSLLSLWLNLWIPKQMYHV